MRIIPGDDGRGKIQLRVDLGILQMEMNGRPDGERPEGFESWLDYYEYMQQAHDETHPDSAAFQLSEEDCLRLWREAVQYYHRYLSFWHLELFELCARDTARNLRLFAFVRAHASDDRHKLQFDQWRPYALMMHARAVATPLVQQRLYEEGLRAIEAGIEAIREFLDDYEQSHRAEECVELVSLEKMARGDSLEGAARRGRPAEKRDADSPPETGSDRRRRGIRGSRQTPRSNPKTRREETMRISREVTRRAARKQSRSSQQRRESRLDVMVVVSSRVGR